MTTEAMTRADLVTVCTANVARSPLLQVRLQWEADRRLRPGAVQVASAGTDAVFGASAASGSAVVATRWDLPLEAHRSRPLHYVDLPATALIVAMTRSHERNIARHAPDAAAHTIRLRELVQLIEQHHDELSAALPAPDASAPRDRIDAAVTAIVARRRRRGGRKLDVPDPIGAEQATYDTLGEELAAASTTLGALLFGPTR